MYEERQVITASRWKLHTEGKEFFLKPCAMGGANRELLFTEQESHYKDDYSRKEKY